MLYIPFGVLIAIVSRMLLLGPTMADSVAIIPISLLCGFILYLEHKKEPPINEAIKQELQQLKNSVDGLKLVNTFRK